MRKIRAITLYYRSMSEAARKIKLSFRNTKMQLATQKYDILFASWDIPAGHTCPAADICFTKADRVTGKLERIGRVPCYAAILENVYKDKRNVNWSNYELSKSETFVDDMNAYIKYELMKKRNKYPSKLGIRVHSFGDFYSWAYFQKWVQIADANPDVMFWGYTKQATFVKWLIDNPRDNMKFVYSHGGKHDKYADSNNLPQCYIVEYDGQYPNVPITCTHDDPANDYEYIIRGESFGIGIH